MLTYVGVFFIEEFNSSTNSSLNKVYSLALILVNTIAVYWISLNYSQKERTAFLVAALYTLSPFHLSIFFFPSQFQFLISETCLLFFMIFYLKNSCVKSTVFVITAFFLNFSLLTIVPFLCLSKTISSRVKIFVCLSAVSILIYLYPLFLNDKSLVLNNYKTLVYLIEKLIIPSSLSIFNYSVIVPNYYSLWFVNLVAFTGLFFGVYYYYKKYPFSEVVLVLILSGGLAVFLPVKFLSDQVSQVYFLRSNLYPFIIFLFLILTLVVLVKYNSKKVEAFIVVIGLTWGLSNINMQQRASVPMEIWNSAISLLPKHYEYEEEIKFDYVKVLIEKNLKYEAEQIIIEAKKEYLNEKWFALHLSLAIERKDDKTIKDIYDELIMYKIPYVNSALPASTP